MLTLNKYWAGTAESFNAVSAGMERGLEYRASMDSNMPSMPSLWGKQDGVAVVDISGSLVSGSAGWGRFFGVLGYDDIRQAIVEAASDVEVKSIMLHVNSGGGAVAGADDLGKFIAKVNTIKPIAVYTDGMMASAAYWIAAGASNLMASSTAIVGSLGILSVHTERSAQLKADGVAVTVVRAGKYKALANSVEPLTEAALAEVQGQVNDLYDIFMAHVATSRGVTVSTADSQMGQGKEFLGKAAVTANLIDKVATYDQALIATKKLDKASGIANNSPKPKGPNMKANLTEVQLAALAAGASLSDVAPVADATVVAPVADVTTPDAAPADAPVAPVADAAPVAPVDAPVAPVADMTAITLLQAQLATANEAVISARVENSNLTAKVASIQATHEGLLTIARTAVANMAVPLGGSADVANNYDASTVIAEHAKLRESFLSKFKVGGVAATAQAEKKDAVQIAPFQYAMIQAAQGK
jgi:signal peptide peptidase SppA